MEFLCKYLGGSRGYGLNTEKSDYDYRGVFIHTEVSKIIGLERFDHFETVSGDQDVKYKELREWFNLLRRGNTEALECLFNENWIEKTEEFDSIRNVKYSFIDSDKLFRCLLGYAASELKLANGERTGKLGGKRKEAIEKFGFSPNNFVNYFRLLQTGITFFNTNKYIVKWGDELYGAFLFNLKTEPQKFELSYLNSLAKKSELELKNSFDSRKTDYKFKNEIANSIIYKIYIKKL